MIAQISHWLELKIWQLAVRALSVARPLSTQITKAKLRFPKQHSIEARPLPRAVRSQWMIALGGWLLGLVLGYLFAIR